MVDLLLVSDLSNWREVFFSRDDEEPDPEVCAVYENKAFEVETLEEAKTTNL